MISAAQAPRLREVGKSGLAVGNLVALGFIAIASVVLVAFFVLQERRVVGVLGMPLDDAWIHFRIAENLATGHGFAVNPGQPTSASTSPLWNVVLALNFLVTKQFIGPAIVIGTFFYLLANVALYYLVLVVVPDRKLAMVAALLLVITGRWVWAALSGMETTFFTALTLWGLLFIFSPSGSRIPRSPGVGAALLGLASLLRPEGFLLILIIVAVTAWPDLVDRRGSSLSEQIRRIAQSPVAPLVVAFLAAALIRCTYTLSTGGGLFGNTFLAQSLPQGNSPYTGPRLVPDLWYLRSVIDSLRGDDFLLGILIPLGMVQWVRLTIRRQPDPVVRSLGFVALLWFVVTPLLNSMLAPNLRHHERYLMPFIPIAVLFGTFGIGFLVEQTLGEHGSWRVPRLQQSASVFGLFVIISGFCLGDALIDARRWAIQYAGDVRSIQAINVALGTWLRDNTPPDAYIAANDIGAISYISNRRILDTVGLAEPSILPYVRHSGSDGVLTYIEQKQPDYVVIWPNWYPEIAAKSDTFTPIHAATMSDPLTATRDSMLGGKEMVVYKTHWSTPKPSATAKTP